MNEVIQEKVKGNNFEQDLTTLTISSNYKGYFFD